MSGPWFVYILQCADGSYYTGISNDVQARLKRHNTGRGARYVRTRLPAVLVWWEYAGTCGEALRLELSIKHLNRQEKEVLVRGAARPKRRVKNESNPCRIFHW